MFGALLGRKLESRVEERGATFNLANLKDPALIRLFGGGAPSSAGIDVNEETALSTGAVHQAVRLVSETMGMLPLHTYERAGDRDKQKRRAPNHPLYAILHRRPNPEQTRIEFISMLVANMVLHNVAYAEIVRDTAERVRALWPIPPHLVTEKRDPQTRERYYEVRVGGESKPLSARQVLRVRGFSPDGSGRGGLLHWGKDAIGTMVSAERAGAALWANGMNPGGILTHPGELGEQGIANLEKTISDKHGGIGQAGRLLILEENMKYEPTGISPKDAELIASRKFSVLEIARHTNIPPHMLMDLDRATFSNIEEQGIQFVTYTLGSFIARIEQQINVDLFSAAEQGRYFAEFNVDGLLRGNILARYQAYQVGVQQGFLSRNEVRDLEGLPPFEGGDLMLEPLNMQPVGGAAKPGAAQDPKAGSAPAQDGDPETRGKGQIPLSPPFSKGETEEEHRGKAQPAGVKERRRLQKSFGAVIAKAAATLVKREAREVKKLAEKHLPGTRGARSDAETRGTNEFLDAAEAYYGDTYKAQIKELLGPVLSAYAEAVAGSVSDDAGADAVPDFNQFLSDYVDMLADARSKTKYGELIELMKNPGGEDLLAAVFGAVDSWVDQEPDEVGTRESVQLGNALANELYKRLGKSVLRVVASPNACPLCLEHDGEVVGTLPPFHKGCTCGVIPEE